MKSKGKKTGNTFPSLILTGGVDFNRHIAKYFSFVKFLSSTSKTRKLTVNFMGVKAWDRFIKYVTSEQGRRLVC